MTKNIIIITHYYNENIVGTLRVKHLIGMLSQQGHEVKVLAGTDSKNRKSFLKSIHKTMIGAVNEKYYVSCGPFYYLLPVVIWGLLYRKKIIIDYRDPWSMNYTISTFSSTRISVKYTLLQFIRKTIERLAYKISDKTIVCTPGMYEYYKLLFNSEKKLLLIMNGFNFTVEDLSSKKIGTNRIEHFVCMGKFLYYSEEKARKTLRTIQKRNQFKKIDVDVTFIGSETEAIKELLSGMNLSSGIKFRFFDRLPYEEAMSIVRSADIGFLIIRNEDFDFGTKIFDFIGLGIPILNTFEIEKSFYKTFKKYLINIEDDYNRSRPDSSFHRDQIWKEHISIFR